MARKRDEVELLIRGYLSSSHQFVPRNVKMRFNVKIQHPNTVRKTLNLKQHGDLVIIRVNVFDSLEEDLLGSSSRVIQFALVCATLIVMTVRHSFTPKYKGEDCLCVQNIFFCYYEKIKAI